jgi:hypothetical protein
MKNSRLAVVGISVLFSGTLSAQALTASAAQNDTPRVSFFADGNVRGAASGEKDATTTSGSLGLAISNQLSDFAAVINIAAKTDTIRKGYGASMVPPGSGGALSAGLVDYRRHNNGSYRGFGAHIYGSVSSARWATGSSPTESEQTTDVGIIGLGTAITYELLRGKVDENFVFAAIDFGLSYRGLFGDIASKENDELKRRLYGSRAENWGGVELGLALQLNLLKGGINWYYFNGNTKGLSGGQIVAGFSIQANLFSGPLKIKGSL